MLETVFFDFGGTLADEPMPHAESIAAFLQDHGIEAPWEEVQRGSEAMEAYCGAWHDDRPDDPSKSLADRFWFNACLQFSKHISAIPDSQDLAEFMHASHTIIPYRLYEDTIPALDLLASRGQKMAIISNWDAPTLEFATRDLGIRKYFVMVLSSRCAECEKPRADIFHEACRRADAKPETSMMVGDSLHADIGGSAPLGMTPVWINRGDGEADRECHQIHKLTELPGLLDKLNGA